PRRTKTLVFAVVARALGCARSEVESRVALEREGLGARDVDEVLATLASARLDAREARLVPFARETVRYHRTAPIQPPMRHAARSEKKEITVLFADLKGFTALGEGLAPAELVTVLNGYLARMSRAIVEHRGHVSKFLGDGILALFGALEANPWQTNDAIHAAL